MRYKNSDYVIVCLNCGAQAEYPNEPDHHAGCAEGESDRWAKHYEAMSEEEQLAEMDLSR